MTLDFIIGYIKGFIKGAFEENYLREILIACLTLIIGYVFDRRKLKREQKLRFQTGISSKVDNALQEIRNLVSKAHEVETLSDSIDALPSFSMVNYKKLAQYPSFMASKEALSEFGITVSKARKMHEQFLDVKSAAFLFVLEKYLIDVAVAVREYEDEIACQAIGLVVLLDIAKWRTAFDKHLVKRLNSPHYKLFTLQGKRWKKLKRRYVEKYINKSNLKKVMDQLKSIPNEN